MFYSQDLNIHFTLKTIESNPSKQQPDSENSDGNTTIKFFLAEFVGWEEDDMSYKVLMYLHEIEWEIEAEEAWSSRRVTYSKEISERSKPDAIS